MSELLIFFWILASVAITALAIVHDLAPSLPQFITDLFLYGKTKGKQKEKTFVKWIEVPKKWFVHFYMLGSVVNGFMAVTVARAFLFGHAPPAILTQILHYVAPKPQLAVNGMNALLLISMMFVQNLRRLYECVYVSVYSNSTMNMLHYLLGFSLYGTFWMTVLSQAPDLRTYRVASIDEEFVCWQNHVAIALFTWASYHHHNTHKRFAELRRDREGNVNAQRHVIPTGGWFQYVSCPHYFFEMVIYCVFQLVGGWQHWTLWSVTLFVLSNQLVAGHVTHAWYRKQYKAYPAERKAVVPGLF